MIFCVKLFVNKEICDIVTFLDLNEAVVYANLKEDIGFICEVEKYENPKIITREFWREAREVEE